MYIPLIGVKIGPLYSTSSFFLVSPNSISKTPNFLFHLTAAAARMVMQLVDLAQRGKFAPKMKHAVLESVAGASAQVSSYILQCYKPSSIDFNTDHF